ncbi:MAG: ATP-binding protein [Bacteroidia bacterium]
MLNRWLFDTIVETAAYFPVVAVLGPRQVGKTTLCKQVAEKMGKQTIILDLELPEDAAVLSNNPSLFFQRNKDKCIIIDEIQRMPELFPIIRAVIDKHRVAGRFIITGSASIDLINQSSESLAGRIAYEHLATLNLIELTDNYSYLSLWLKGGFPQPFLMANDDMVAKWYDNFIRTYLERDLPMLGLNVQPILMYKLWSMIAHTHGGIWNASNIGRSLGITSTTVNKYIDFLEHAFIIRQLRPYKANLGKRLVKSPKVYVRDSGLLHALLQLKNPDKIDLMPFVGASWEGFVVEQICSYLPQNIKSFYYRTHDGTECDLVLIKNGKPFYTVEIKYGSLPTPTKSHTLALKDLGSKHNYVVVPETLSFTLSNGADVVSLKEFMKHIWPKLK